MYAKAIPTMCKHTAGQPSCGRVGQSSHYFHSWFSSLFFSLMYFILTFLICWHCLFIGFFLILEDSYENWDTVLPHFPHCFVLHCSNRGGVFTSWCYLHAYKWLTPLCKDESEEWLPIEHPCTVILLLLDLAAMLDLTSARILLKSFRVPGVSAEKKWFS